MQQFHSLHLNPAIAGEWIEEKLYLVDVKKNVFFLLTEDTSHFLYLVHEHSWAQAKQTFRQNAGTDFPDSKIEELLKAGILVEKAEGAAMIEHASFGFSGSTSSQTILESGLVEARIVATGTGTLPGSGGS